MKNEHPTIAQRLKIGLPFLIMLGALILAILP